MRTIDAARRLLTRAERRLRETSRQLGHTKRLLSQTRRQLRDLVEWAGVLGLAHSESETRRELKVDAAREVLRKRVTKKGIR